LAGPFSTQPDLSIGTRGTATSISTRFGTSPELIDIAHRYYPRGLAYDDHQETDEYLQLVAARRLAGTECERWQALLARMGEQFPGRYIQNGSLHLPTGATGSGYSGAIFLPTGPGEYFHTVGFLISFLVPYYLVYGSRVVEDVEARAAHLAAKPRAGNVYVGDTCHILPAEIVKPELAAEKEGQFRRILTSFAFSSDEQPHADWLAREIEATFGCEPMPPEVGNIIVPDVATNLRLMGQATLYDCLLGDDWYFDR
jgi:hypothetical protein